jgi:hypothetical protein
VSVTNKKWDDGSAPAPAPEKDDLDLDDLGMEPMNVDDGEGEELDEEAKREAEALSARTRKLVVREDGSVARRGTRKREPAVSKQDAAKHDLQPLLQKKWKKYNATKRKTWASNEAKIKKAAVNKGRAYKPTPFKEMSYKVRISERLSACHFIECFFFLDRIGWSSMSVPRTRRRVRSSLA